MFKSAADLQHFITRTASHSTKPSARGRVDLVPASARLAETDYNTHHEEWKVACQQLHEFEERLADVNKRLKLRYADKKDYLRAFSCIAPKASLIAERSKS